MKIYIDKNDWWVGYYRGENSHYVCLLPCVVIRWRRYSRLFSHFLRPHKWVACVEPDGRRYEICTRTPCRGRTWRWVDEG